MKPINKHPSRVPAASPSKTDKPVTVDAQQAAPFRWGWLTLLAVSLVLFGVSAVLAYHHGLSGWELKVFRHINDLPDGLRLPFRAITMFHESLWIGVIAVIVTFLIKQYRLAWQLAAATVAGYAFAYLGKHFIARARPIELISNVHIRTNESGMGYPSGHVMMISVLALTLLPYLPKGWRWLVLLPIPAMMLSRIYLGVHAPLDVIGGFAVGAIVVSTMRLLPLFLRRFFRFD